MIEAAYQAQDLLDFSRHGFGMYAAMKLIPFLNAHLQGLDKAWRTIGQPIVDVMRGDQVFASDPAALNNAIFAAVKAVGVFGVFGAMWAAICGDNRGYRNATPYAKGTHLIVPVGSRQLWIPKPFELSLGFTAGEYAYQRLVQDEPRAASMFASTAWQILEPPSDIPLLKTGYELAANYNLFAGRPIVPQNLQRLTPAEQYNEHTSSLSKMLGSAIGVSPIKVDYAIGSLFGNWGPGHHDPQPGRRPGKPNHQHGRPRFGPPLPQRPDTDLGHQQLVLGRSG
jgi:hypothetical protein